MRKLVYKTISEVPLVAAEVKTRIYQRGTLGKGRIPENPQAPFIIYGEIPTVPHQVVSETSNAQDHYFQIYVMYDAESFIKVDDILQDIRAAMGQLEGAVSPSGARCLGVRFRGFSQDYDDDTYDTLVRFGTWQITGSS